jgi:hypothetical protein
LRSILNLRSNKVLSDDLSRSLNGSSVNGGSGSSDKVLSDDLSGSGNGSSDWCSDHMRSLLNMGRLSNSLGSSGGLGSIRLS